MNPRYVVRSTPAAGGEGFLCAHVHESMEKAVACFLEPRAGVTKVVQRLEGQGDVWTSPLTRADRESFVRALAKIKHPGGAA